MSLRAAVTEIVAGMKEEAARYQHDDVGRVFLLYARQLEIALRASLDDDARQPAVHPASLVGLCRNPPRDMADVFADPDAVAAMGLEERGPAVAEVEGDEDGLVLPVNPQMPVGAKTLIAGRVYTLTGERKLRYLPEETEKVLRNRQA